MSLGEIAEKIGRGYWGSDLPGLARLVSVHAVSPDFDICESEFMSSVRKGRAGRALNWFLAGLMLGSSSYFDRIRRHGALRPSKYEFEASTLVRIIGELLRLEVGLNLGPEMCAYLQSMRTLAELAGQIRIIRLNLLKELRRNRTTIIKSLLAVVDLWFLKGRPGNKDLSPDDAAFFSQEEIAEGFSYLLHLYHTGVGDIEENVVQLVGSSRQVEGLYQEMLLDAAKIRAVFQWEVLIDVLDYTLRRTADREYIFSPPSPRLEQSIRLGFIQNEMKNLIELQKLPRDKWISTEDAAGELHKRMPHPILERVEVPISRFRFHLPVFEPLIELLKGDAAFLEDLWSLHAGSSDSMVSPDEFRTFELTDGLTVWDVLRAQRLCNLYRHLIEIELGPYRESEPDLAFQSLIPTFREEKLVEFFTIALSREQALRLVELLTWVPGQRMVFDVQYYPLVAAGTASLLPLAIFGRSNLPRNLLLTQRRRLGAADPLPTIVSAAIARFIPMVATEVQIDFSGDRCEVDVMVLLDDILFVFECKTSLLPTGPHEMRTVVDHVRKAARQLSKIQALAENPEFLRRLGDRLKWSLTRVRRIVTCIILSNRMLFGFRLSGHPVRAPFELLAYIREGSIGVNNDSVRLREEGPITGEQLGRYLEDDVVHEAFFEAMVPGEFVYRFRRALVCCETFALDSAAAAENLKGLVE